MINYHGLIKWRFVSDPTNTERCSSFSIERPEGWSYCMTLIQFKNNFIAKVHELLGDEEIDIMYTDMKTGNKITII